VRLTSAPSHGPAGLGIDKILPGTTPAVALLRLDRDHAVIERRKEHDAAHCYPSCFSDAVAKLRPAFVEQVAHLPMENA
jgi:hypothetical protein